ncbi:hypothetical protein BABINDRAFT_57034 [Babjeviella inositovora NRRL Y-12698]|uniref:SRR1-like domain-containing protein n=1 Tax=Babjeviella inositovora NRRL Y-12698 TaxID=984486 RepID=A0A1E3QZ93_9ASCO|nr:uncharacterized protein BABINDRAFT_57034 [Babjeviella inositovora NRRL Y-12698]ODQ82931.1 hypothetical protein BABINDRAFT_57034 [Babjeviella inositovora NRRL Y-12698]
MESFKRYAVGSERVKQIRCLALGSPSQDAPALYQLAFLRQVADHLQTTEVSLHDPAFNDTDIAFITGLGYSVSEEDPYKEVPHTFYFLPHAPLGLTETILSEYKPEMFMANDIKIHGERKTKVEMYEKYPTIALAANSVAKACPKVEAGVPVKSTPVDDGFETVKKKPRKRTNKNLYVEPKIEYDYTQCFFKTCSMTRYSEIEGPWGNSFSDLALHIFE